MSYDVSMMIDTGGEYPAEVCDVGNYTYNVSSMFRLAIGGNGLRELDGKTGCDCAPLLERAVAHLRAPENAETYRSMNPPKQMGQPRWGDRISL